MHLLPQDRSHSWDILGLAWSSGECNFSPCSYCFFYCGCYQWWYDTFFHSYYGWGPEGPVYSLPSSCSETVGSSVSPPWTLQVLVGRHATFSSSFLPSWIIDTSAIDHMRGEPLLSDSWACPPSIHHLSLSRFVLLMGLSSLLLGWGRLTYLPLYLFLQFFMFLSFLAIFSSIS